MTAAAGITRSEVSGFVYFVRSGESQFVKIGWAADPGARLLDLQCGNPDDLMILGTVAGTMRDELAWHQRYAHLSHRNEWFHLTPELELAIKLRETIAEEIWRARQPEELPESWQRYKDFLTANRSRGMAKLSLLDEQRVREIRQDRRTVRVIAAHYGVSKTCIQDIRMRKTWRHVA